jgi:uncharacterized protein YndB with AHSA1/START domain
MYTVVAQRTISAPPTEMWDYLTEPRLLARWFADTERFVAGESFRFNFGDGDFFAGQVENWQPNVSLGVDWKFDGIGPSYRVLFSILPRKNGSEISVQDRGALTLDEAECLRVGWSEFLMRLEKAVTLGQNARFKWRKAINFTVDLRRDGLACAMKALGDPSWYSEAFQGGRVNFELIDSDRILATYSSDLWGPAETRIRVKHEQIADHDYLFVAHEGWQYLPSARAEMERRRYVPLWLGGVSSMIS